MCCCLDLTLSCFQAVLVCDRKRIRDIEAQEGVRGKFLPVGLPGDASTLAYRLGLGRPDIQFAGLRLGTESVSRRLVEALYVSIVRQSELDGKSVVPELRGVNSGTRGFPEDF